VNCAPIRVARNRTYPIFSGSIVRILFAVHEGTHFVSDHVIDDKSTPKGAPSYNAISITYASERKICLIVKGEHPVIHFYFRRRS